MKRGRPKVKEVEKIKEPEKIEPVEPAVQPEPVKPVEVKPAVRVFSEREKQFMKDNNMDEYIRHFGKP